MLRPAFVGWSGTNRHRRRGTRRRRRWCRCTRSAAPSSAGSAWRTCRSRRTRALPRSPSVTPPILQPWLLQIVEHLLRRHVHLLAEALRDHGDVDVCQAARGVFERTPPPSSEVRMPASRQRLRVVDRRVGLVPVDMQRAAAGDIEHRERRQIVVVAAAHDRALAVVRHDEGQRRVLDLAGWRWIRICAAMSRNMRPSQSSARWRSGRA